MFQIRQAAHADRRGIDALLSLAHTDEPTHQRLDSDVLYVADSDAGLIGVGGLNPCGDSAGLLHSLLVRPGFRKRRIARQLYQQVLEHAYGLGIRELYTLTASGRTYFETLGFIPTDDYTAPESVRRSLLQESFDPTQATLMRRPLSQGSTHEGQECPQSQDPAHRAAEHFDAGYYCAESVLMALGEHMGINETWIPRIATGFCTGASRTWGNCGALSGGIMAINLAFGRSYPDQSATPNYDAVQRFSQEFHTACGGTRCSELLGCDLESKEGRAIYRHDHLRHQCREYVTIATRLAADLIGDKPSSLE